MVVKNTEAPLELWDRDEIRMVRRISIMNVQINGISSNTNYFAIATLSSLAQEGDIEKYERCQRVSHVVAAIYDYVGDACWWALWLVCMICVCIDGVCCDCAQV